MSTQPPTTNQQAPYPQGPYQAPYPQAPYPQGPYQAPYPQGSYPRATGPSWFRIWAVVIGTVVAAALVVLAVALLHGHYSSAPSNIGPSTSTSVPVHPTSPVHPTNPVTPAG